MAKQLSEFQINPHIMVSDSELIALIFNTESQDDEEKQYWFDLLPSISEQKKNELYIILETERTKLEDLENSINSLKLQKKRPS